MTNLKFRRVHLAKKRVLRQTREKLYVTPLKNVPMYQSKVTLALASVCDPLNHREHEKESNMDASNVWIMKELHENVIVFNTSDPTH